MNAIGSTIATTNARLPASYEAAKAALAECTRIDECQTWANKAEALASYAKQAEDDTMRKHADRIQARAIRRCGELLKQFDGKGNNQHGEGDRLTQRQAAIDAGMSHHQQKQAVRVANVPEHDFDGVVESDNPPTVTRLAEMGTKKREYPQPEWLDDHPPAGFREATHYLGALRRYVEQCNSPELLATGLSPAEQQEVRQLVGKADHFHDVLVTRLKG